MDKFTASNGYQVKSSGRDNRIDIDLTRNGGHYGQALVLTIEQHAALREFFQAERDEALGRWRDPDDPLFSVYPSRDDPEDRVVVVNEGTGYNYFVRRGQTEAFGEPFVLAAARAYFAAHPEPKPLPTEPNAIIYSEAAWAVARRTTDGQRWSVDTRTDQLTDAEMVTWTRDWVRMVPEPSA